MESNNNRELINSLKQLNPMSAAENVLSMRKISHRANSIKNMNYGNIRHRSEGCPISSEVPCFISKGGPCMKQVPVLLDIFRSVLLQTRPYYLIMFNNAFLTHLLGSYQTWFYGGLFTIQRQWLSNCCMVLY